MQNYTKTNLKTIILHDYFESLEGGGRLSSILAKGLDTELGYGFAKAEHPFLAEGTQHDLHAYSAIPLWRQIKLAHTFTQHTTFLKKYKNVIYSGFYTPLAIHNHPHGRNILYCHTPPRFIYDQREYYLKRLPKWLRPALQAFINYLQPRYEKAIAQMDILIANSENVRQRIQHYLGKDAIVIHPPCDTTKFKWQGQGDYYLSTSRLDSLKRVEKIIQAFLTMPTKRLIIASGGKEKSRLQKLANQAPHIQFTGWLNDQQLAILIGKAIATLYIPKEEDFGMSPLESMAAGKPVIGVAEGGLLETIIPEKTGILLKSNINLQAICQAVETLTPQRAKEMRTNCEKQEQRFRKELFIEKMRSLIK